MKIPEIKPLLQDMGRNKAKVDKFAFYYNGVKFDVVVLIDRTPFELLFGIVDYNFTFTLELHKGFYLDGLPDDVFFILRKLLRLNNDATEELTSYKFLRYFAERIPKRYSKKKVEPHEIAFYKRDKIAESDKIYFKGWLVHGDNGRHTRNLEKTKELLGEEAYEYCKRYNISSCWSDNPSEMKAYYPPQHYQNKDKEHRRQLTAEIA